MECLPAHARAVGRSQKHDAGGDFARLDGPAHGARELFLLLLRHGRGDKRRPHGTRRDGVDPDTLADLLVAEPSRERHDRPFRRRVIQQVGPADVVVDTGVIDDGAAWLHVRQRVLGEVEEGVDVSVERVDPLVPAGRSPSAYSFARHTY